MTVALSGVFSGMDTDSLVTRLIAVNARPMYQLAVRKAEWESKASAVVDVESRLSTLKALLADMRDSDKLRAVSASSSDTTLLTVTAGGSASEGAHEIVVNQLAKTEKLVHSAGLAGQNSTITALKSTALNIDGVADADATWFTTTASGATYTFDFGAETDIDSVVFAVSTGYTMNQVAALINVRSQAVSGYDGASVEYDSQESEYFLRLTAEESATAGTMTQALTAGDAIAELNDDADWSKTAAGGTQFQYTYDGTTRTLQLTYDTTLADLRDLINNDGGNPGVVASVLEYNGTYHLVLSGRDTGTDYTIAIDGGTTLSSFGAGDFTETQSAQDAELRVDGYPAGNWMERSSNTITDVVPGLTFNLRAAGTVNVTLSRNTSGLKQDLSNFVGIYNGLVTAVDTYAGYDEENETSGLMQGDAMLNGIIYRIRAALTGTTVGFADGEDTYIMPVQIGLKIDRYGELGIVGTSTATETSLDDAISDDYLGVLSLIGALGAGKTDDSYIQFDSAEEATEPGNYHVEVDFAVDGSIATAWIDELKVEKLMHSAGLPGLSSTVGALKSTALNTHGVADPAATWFTTGTPEPKYDFTFGAETTIDDVKRWFTAWVEQVYHHQTHSETGQSPLERWRQSAPTAPIPTPDRLTE
ncbi:hypothetical protein LCGC14_1530150, partial [marine sediment metagenome]